MARHPRMTGSVNASVSALRAWIAARETRMLAEELLGSDVRMRGSGAILVTVKYELGEATRPLGISCLVERRPVSEVVIVRTVWD